MSDGQAAKPQTFSEVAQAFQQLPTTWALSAIDELPRRVANETPGMTEARRVYLIGRLNIAVGQIMGVVESLSGTGSTPEQANR